MVRLQGAILFKDSDTAKTSGATKSPALLCHAATYQSMETCCAISCSRAGCVVAPGSIQLITLRHSAKLCRMTTSGSRWPVGNRSAPISHRRNLLGCSSSASSSLANHGFTLKECGLSRLTPFIGDCAFRTSPFGRQRLGNVLNNTHNDSRVMMSEFNPWPRSDADDAELGGSFTSERKQAIEARFGTEARFHTCSAATWMPWR